jgi:hypothetical protein
MKVLPLSLLAVATLNVACSGPESARAVAEPEPARPDLRLTARRPAPPKPVVPSTQAPAEIGARDAARSNGGILPLAPGTVWIYAGTVKWTNAETQRVEEKSVDWKVEVGERLSRGHVNAAVLRGHPSDLAHYREGRAPGTYLVVRVGPGKYYLLRGRRAQEALERLRDPNDLLHNLVHEDEIFLDLPLVPGKVFGEAGQLTRQDASYVWVVEEERAATLEGVKGLRGGRRTVFRLLYRTLPDREELEFVPEVGITRYRYVHHGTVAEADARLVEFRPGKE